MNQLGVAVISSSVLYWDSIKHYHVRTFWIASAASSSVTASVVPNFSQNWTRKETAHKQHFYTKGQEWTLLLYPLSEIINYKLLRNL